MVATAAVSSRRCLAYEFPQALVLLATGRAAIQVGTKPWDCCLGIEAAKLEIDVAVEFIEANVATDLRALPVRAGGRLFRSGFGSPSRLLLRPGVKCKSGLG